MIDDLQSGAYVVATILFIIGLKFLGQAKTARLGNLISAGGMGLAVVAAVVGPELNLLWIAGALLIGGVVGLLSAVVVKMTSMPELVALFNGFGGLASLLLAAASAFGGDAPTMAEAGAVSAAALIGGLAFTGSLIAFGKLQGTLPGKPIIFPGQLTFNALILLVSIGAAVAFVLMPTYAVELFAAVAVLSFVLGVLAVVRIGGADMPIVVSLMNSYSGIAASMAGFAVGNVLLVVAGALVGASGLILTRIMCKAMNRSLANVLFGGFGAVASGPRKQGPQGEVRSASAEDAYYMLEAARKVLFVPGYGMAVAQAQHTVKELADFLQKNGAEVAYAIHPVAGRMPGHMNVLLAEANVPYEQLLEPGDVNPTMEQVDVAVIIGANDVVNPDAREEPTSPLYGMPVIDADRARNVLVLKRSMNPGFSGVENALFFKENTRLVFGDAKKTIAAMVAEFKEALAAAA